MKKNLVIVGAGFAGVSVYTSLPKQVKDSFHITLIDRHNYFLFTPLLHEVATGALYSNNIVEPIERIIGSEVTFIQDTVTAVVPQKRSVHLEKHHSVPYDLAIVALGSSTHFYDVPGAQEHCFVLKDLHDAQVLRDHFISNFQKASMVGDSVSRKELLSTIIVGGGPTGVELAAETAELFFHTFKKYYRGSMNPHDATITLVNSAGSLMKQFSLSSQKYAEQVLTQKGITVMNDVLISEVTPHGVRTSEGDIIRGETVIWAAGVAPANVEAHDIPEERGRWKTTDTLQLEGFPDVFVLGDLSFAPTIDGKGYPMLAQVAKQQGVVTARNIKHLMNDQPLEIFRYREKGKLASLGQWHAIAEFSFIHLYGPFAWFLWRTAYLMNFASWNKRLTIMVDWTLNIFSPRDVTKI